MKKSKKSILEFLLTFCLCVSFLAIGYGCNDEENPEEPDGSSQDIVFRIEKTKENILVGEVKKLSVIVSGLDEKPKFEVSSPSVTVDTEGNIEGITVGKALITVTYGEEKKTIDVQVELGGHNPVYNFNQILDDEITLAVNDILDLSGYVYFNDKKFEDFSCAYEFSDATVGAMDTKNVNVFVPVKKGETTIRITATWRGLTNPAMVKEINIKVIDFVELYVNDGLCSEFELYTVNEHCGKTYPTEADFLVVAKINGETVEEKTEIISGNDVVLYENDKIKAQKAGTAKIEISCASGEDDVFKQVLTVNVNKPVAIYDEQIFDFDATLGTLPVAEVFGKETTILEAVLNGENVPVEEGKLTNIKVTSATPEVRKLIVFDDAVGYEIRLKAYTRIIKTASDLNCISYSDDAKILTGYYILANNIDATGYTAVDHGWQVYAGGLADKQLGFKGVFDGQGYTIKGMTVGTGGLFGRIIGEGRVINLGLTDVHYKTGVTTSAMACDVSCSATEYDSPATFENIYFRTDEIPTGKDEWGIVSASFVNEMYNDAKMVNCIFEVNGESETNGSLVAELYTDCMDQSYKDVYMISETPLLINKTSGAERICDANNITYDPSLVPKDVFNIKRYATKDEMKEAGNDYTAFSTEYWDTTSGIPIWKTMSE